MTLNATAAADVNSRVMGSRSAQTQVINFPSGGRKDPSRKPSLWVSPNENENKQSSLEEVPRLYVVRYTC